MNSSMANNSVNTHHRKKQITWEKRPQILRIGRIAKFNFAQLISDLTFLVWISYFYQELHSAPPLIFGNYGTSGAQFDFGHKKGEKLNFPKTPKMAIFNINLIGKVPKSTHNPLFSSKIP